MLWVLRARSLKLASLVVLFMLAHIPLAMADEAGVAAQQLGRADELFTRGKQRLAANDYAVACSLLAESYQLDPATGSLLALAMCHERQGKLASAFREYQEAAERSQREGRSDREEAARVQVAALRDRVSTLTLHSAHSTKDLTIRVNGLSVAQAELGQTMPVDGGFVLVEVSGAGKIPWQERIEVADGGEALTLTLPELEAQEREPPAKAAPPVRAEPVPLKPAPKRARSASEIAGITLLAAGGAAALTALGFTIVAIRKNNDSNKSCDGDYCTAQGSALRLDARIDGDIATISALTASGVAAAGLIAYLIGRKRRVESAREHDSKARTSAWFTRHALGATLSGAF